MNEVLSEPFLVTAEHVVAKYSTAVLIAAGANVAGMAMALTMPRHGWREGG